MDCYQSPHDLLRTDKRLINLKLPSTPCSFTKIWRQIISFYCVPWIVCNILRAAEFEWSGQLFSQCPPGCLTKLQCLTSAVATCRQCCSHSQCHMPRLSHFPLGTIFEFLLTWWRNNTTLLFLSKKQNATYFKIFLYN